MIVNRLLVLILVVNALTLTGCWNRRELNELAFVTAIGLDQSTEKNKVRVSFQVVNPSEVTPGQLGGGTSSATPVIVYSETGNTLFEVIRKISPKVPRNLFFSHVRLVVIGESLARQGIDAWMDMFERSNEIRYTARVAVARGTTAENLISTLTPLERIPANANIGKMDFSEKVWGHSIRVNIDDVINKLGSEESEPIMSGLTQLGTLKGTTRQISRNQILL